MILIDIIYIKKREREALCRWAENGRGWANGEWKRSIKDLLDSDDGAVLHRPDVGSDAQRGPHRPHLQEAGMDGDARHLQQKVRVPIRQGRPQKPLHQSVEAVQRREDPPRPQRLLLGRASPDGRRLR